VTKQQQWQSQNVDLITNTICNLKDLDVLVIEFLSPHLVDDGIHLMEGDKFESTIIKQEFNMINHVLQFVGIFLRQLVLFALGNQSQKCISLLLGALV
jgi:hypothetical protein